MLGGGKAAERGGMALTGLSVRRVWECVTRVYVASSEKGNENVQQRTNNVYVDKVIKSEKTQESLLLPPSVPARLPQCTDHSTHTLGTA